MRTVSAVVQEQRPQVLQLCKTLSCWNVVPGQLWAQEGHLGIKEGLFTK